MGLFFAYLIQSAFCLLMFYLFYSLLLSKETFHRINRIGLLGLLPLASVLPFFKPAALPEPLLTATPAVIPDMNAPVTVQAASGSQVNWLWVSVLGIYGLGVLFFYLKVMYGYWQLMQVLRKGEKRKMEHGTTLFILDGQPVPPFSWMKYIVMSRKDWEENGTEILIHEQEHIRLKHSWDLLIVQLYQVIYWFNPAVWLLKRELQVIHEYEADEKVLQKGIDAKRYQLLLIKKAVGTQRFTSMANSFNHSKIKKRITMMLKRKSNPWLRLKYLYVLPLSAAMVAAFTYPEIARAITDVSAVKFSEIIPLEEKSTEQYNPASDGGNVAATPPVTTDPLFLIDDVEATRAEFDRLDPQEIESMTVITDHTTLQLYYNEYGTKIKNGLVKVTTKKGLTALLPPASELPAQMSMENALILLDGVEITKEELSKIDVEQIDQVSVIKANNQDFIKYYGEKAKGGIIVISTKK